VEEPAYFPQFCLTLVKLPANMDFFFLHGFLHGPPPGGVNKPTTRMTGSRRTPHILQVMRKETFTRRVLSSSSFRFTFPEVSE